MMRDVSFLGQLSNAFDYIVVHKIQCICVSLLNNLIFNTMCQSAPCFLKNTEYDWQKINLRT